jgi:hypothetical protein
LALKVQRKVSNGVAGLAAAGSSLDRPKIAAVPAPQRSTDARASIAAEILALGPSCVSHTAQLKREWSLWSEFGGFPEIRATFQRDILRRHF